MKHSYRASEHIMLEKDHILVCVPAGSPRGKHMSPTAFVAECWQEHI